MTFMALLKISLLVFIKSSIIFEIHLHAIHPSKSLNSMCIPSHFQSKERILSMNSFTSFLDHTIEFRLFDFNTCYSLFLFPKYSTNWTFTILSPILSISVLAVLISLDGLKFISFARDSCSGSESVIGRFNFFQR